MATYITPDENGRPKIPVSPSGTSYRIHIDYHKKAKNFEVVIENYEEQLTDADTYKIFLLRKHKSYKGFKWCIPWLGANTAGDNSWPYELAGWDIKESHSHFWNDLYKLNTDVAFTFNNFDLTVNEDSECTVFSKCETFRKSLDIELKDRGNDTIPLFKFQCKHLDYGVAIFKQVNGRWLRVSNEARFKLCIEKGYILKVIL